MHIVLYMSGELCYSSVFLILIIPFILLFLDTLLTIVSIILDCHADYCGMLMEASTVCTLIIFLLFVVARLRNLIV